MFTILGMLSGVKVGSSLTQCYVTLCCSLFSSITMASIIALNSLLVSSLQTDPDMNLSFEETSWISKLFSIVRFLSQRPLFSLKLGSGWNSW